MNSGRAQAPRAAEFLSPLRYEDLSQGDQILWLKLTWPFRYYSAVLQSEAELPIDFECDGESVPSRLYSLVPPFGAARKGAVAHDGLYTFAGYYRPGGSSAQALVKVNRATADAVYRELLVAAGVGKCRAWIRYVALRAAGFAAWNEHRKQDGNVAAQTALPI